MLLRPWYTGRVILQWLFDPQSVARARHQFFYNNYFKKPTGSSFGRWRKRWKEWTATLRKCSNLHAGFDSCDVIGQFFFVLVWCLYFVNSCFFLFFGGGGLNLFSFLDPTSLCMQKRVDTVGVRRLAPQPPIMTPLMQIIHFGRIYRNYEP